MRLCCFTVIIEYHIAHTSPILVDIYYLNIEIHKIYNRQLDICRDREGARTERSRCDLAWLKLWECLRRIVAIRRRVLTSTMGRKETGLWHRASRHFTALPISPFFSCWSANSHSPSTTPSIWIKFILPFFVNSRVYVFFSVESECNASCLLALPNSKEFFLFLISELGRMFLAKSLLVPRKWIKLRSSRRRAAILNRKLTKTEDVGSVTDGKCYQLNSVLKNNSEI